MCSALTADLNISGSRTIKVQGICERDRSVSAGRSQLLSDYPSLYVLLGDCQGVVGHREGDFDFRYRLSHLFPYVNNIPFCTLFSDPVASPGVGAQSIHQPEENLVVWIDFDPHDTFGTHVAACFTDMFNPSLKPLPRFAPRVFRVHTRGIELCSKLGWLTDDLPFNLYSHKFSHMAYKIQG